MTNAERGTRSAEQKWKCRGANDLALLFRVPTSAFRLPGGAER